MFFFVFLSKFSHVPSLLSLCLHNLCHKELIDIISRARLYEPILLEVCACMSQIYLRAESKLMGKPSATATHDAASEHTQAMQRPAFPSLALSHSFPLSRVCLSAFWFAL